jgi:hypothetical protein
MRPTLVCLTLVAAVVAPAGSYAVDCDVHRYRGFCENYPGWNLWTNRDPYPSQLSGWPICTSEDGAQVESLFPSGECDPSGPTPIEVGRCEPAAYFYEKIGGFRAKPWAHYAFLFNRDHCEPCAYEVRSAVDTCQLVCDDLIGQLGFDGSDFVPMTADDPRAMRSVVIDSGRYEGKTAYETCRRLCGPEDGSAPLVGDGRLGVLEAKGDHWFHTIYGRDWNPNKNLDNWMRSYTVNPDKRTAPTNACRKYMTAYCEQVATDDADEQKCLEVGAGDGVKGSAGLCEAWHGNYLCDGTCYAYGRDAPLIPEHVCLGRDVCDEQRAVCQLKR